MAVVTTMASIRKFSQGENSEETLIRHHILSEFYFRENCDKIKI
jgi:hypothetical protein